MPTAFTERIEKGEITNFKDFAKLCTRAFSAAIHMRDESLDSSYRKRYVDPYYLESLDEVKHELLFLEQYPHEAYESEKKKIIEDLEFCEKEISKRLENKKLVDKIFKEANEWVVPTDEHIGFRNFVIFLLIVLVVYKFLYNFYLTLICYFVFLRVLLHV